VGDGCGVARAKIREILSARADPFAPQNHPG
jgi:hypothetical protein